MRSSGTGIKGTSKHPILKAVGGTLLGLASLIVAGVVVLTCLDQFLFKRGNDEVDLGIQAGTGNEAISDPEADDLEQGAGTGETGRGEGENANSEEEDLANNDPNRWHDTTDPNKNPNDSMAETVAYLNKTLRATGYEIKLER